MTSPQKMDSSIPETLAALAVDIHSLRPYAANPRNGDTEAIKRSLRHHGQYRPIVVREGSNEILAGNHTYAAAMELGWKTIAATFVQCDDQQAARIVIVDNRTNDLAKYDDGLLAELLQGLDGLDGTGFDDRALADLLARTDFGPVGEDEQPRLDEKSPVKCPECGASFVPK